MAQQQSDSHVEREMYPNGRLFTETPYLDGKKHGMARVWDRDGNISSQIPYVDDKLHGMARFWHLGHPTSFHLFERGECLSSWGGECPSVLLNM